MYHAWVTRIGTPRTDCTDGTPRTDCTECTAAMAPGLVYGGVAVGTVRLSVVFSAVGAAPVNLSVSGRKALVHHGLVQTVRIDQAVGTPNGVRREYGVGGQRCTEGVRRRWPVYGRVYGGSTAGTVYGRVYGGSTAGYGQCTAGVRSVQQVRTVYGRCTVYKVRSTVRYSVRQGVQ